MHLGILKVDSVRDEFQSTFGDYPDMFESLLRAADPLVRISVFDVQQGTLPPVDECDGYLITGSRDSVYDDLPWIPPLVAFMAELRERRIKLAGICFGHQLVAHFFGGKVGPADVGWAVGAHASQLVARRGWMEPAVAKLNLLSSHKDQVKQLPPDAEVYATNSFCPIAGFTVADHTLTIQGHPEFRKDYANALMTFRRDLLGEATYEAGIDSLTQTTHEDVMSQWLINFFRGTGSQI